MALKFAGLSLDAIKDLDFSKFSNEDLAAGLDEARTEASTLFALTEPTVDQVNRVEALVASLGAIESEQKDRAKVVADAAKRFANARTAFSSDASDDEEKDKPVKDEEFSADETVEGVEGDEPVDEDGDEDVEGDEGDEEVGDEGDAEAAVTASGNDVGSQRISMANRSTSRKGSATRKVGARSKRPDRAETPPVTITAAADVEGFATGQALKGMGEVVKAIQARAKAFPAFSERNARAVRKAEGIDMDDPNGSVLRKFGTAQFDISSQFQTALTASSGPGAEHRAIQETIKAHQDRVKAGLNFGTEEALTAAGWCAPSPVAYNFLSNYEVSGLLTLPEVDAPRGGLMITQGPQLAQTTYANVDNFGFGGTEAEAETFGEPGGAVKECETIVCPEFTDHRLDWTGYCWKIPILTEKAFPELVEDALRLSDVLYAHKMNKRFIGDLVAGSPEIDATNALGGTMLDTLEAFVQVAIKERRWWLLGENAVMEVKLPVEAKDIFKFDMARRNGLALDDVATDQKVAALFAAHNLSVEYVTDWQERHGAAKPTTGWPDTITGLMYPAGTWVKAVEDVINLRTVYDAASLSINEYTGVFFEQGVMTVKMGYRSHQITVPVCSAGRTGAADLTCVGGSF